MKGRITFLIILLLATGIGCVDIQRHMHRQCESDIQNDIVDQLYEPSENPLKYRKKHTVKLAQTDLETRPEAKGAFFYIVDFFYWLGCKFVTCDKPKTYGNIPKEQSIQHQNHAIVEKEESEPNKKPPSSESHSEIKIED